MPKSEEIHQNIVQAARARVDAALDSGIARVEWDTALDAWVISCPSCGLYYEALAAYATPQRIREILLRHAANHNARQHPEAA